MKALVFNGVVVQLETTPFPVHESLQWVDCPVEVCIGWVYDGSTFSPPPPEV